MKLISLQKYVINDDILGTEDKIDSFRDSLRKNIESKFKELERAKIETITNSTTKIIG